ncbi:putative retrotransposon hot spot protein (RHS) [Trypanosoma cruzi]|uniref:Putative retrotransposon hot spot protein (RHS) n=1 Tax=Trypanosoma cruzi TaxID=5693 RepID=A0A2V2VM70_TRYCR|nr:putative retrotransposon hot spot protein (RHS) [Trypanosoma cruzi]
MGDNVAVLLPIARRVAAEAVCLDCFADRRCSAAAWRTDHRAVRAPAQRHWDCGTKNPRLSFGASGTCRPRLGGASGMLHRTGAVMARCSGCGDGSDAATCRGVEERRRPNWTLDGRLDKVLLEGKERIARMWLNGFLRNYIGGRALRNPMRTSI